MVFKQIEHLFFLDRRTFAIQTGKGLNGWGEDEEREEGRSEDKRDLRKCNFFLVGVYFEYSTKTIL